MPCMCGSRTRASASARRRRAKAISTCRRCSPPARSPAPTRCIRATDFCRRMRGSPKSSTEHGIHFIGPKPAHIRLMGDKIEAKRTAMRLGIPVVPGSDGGVTSDAEALAMARDHRLSGAGEGGGRRRRPRHEDRRDAGENSPRRSRPRAPRPRPPSATTPSISKNICSVRATSRSRCWATATAAPSISASATARCSGGTRRCWEESPSPALNDAARDDDRRDRREGDARAQISRRRHRRVPLRGRQVLFHRDEYPHPGRASGDRDDHRHRPRCWSRSGSRPAASCRSRRTT